MATTRKTSEPPSDPVLREIEPHLADHPFHPRSPATDAAGHVWKKVSFAGPRTVLEKMVQHPLARGLETLTVGDLNEGDVLDGAIEVLGAGPPLPALRELRVGLVPEGQDATVGFGDRTCGDLSALATACPHLEVLRLLCPGFIAGDHPTLRVLDARMGARPSSVASLARASLPHLEELHLGFVVDEEEGLYPSLVWTADTLAPLLDGDALPSLRRLCLWPTQEDDTLLRKALASPLGRRASIELCSLDDLEAGTDAYTF